MIAQNILLRSESYTHSNWLYRNVYVGFSRLYYIIDGEAYYEEGGNRIKFKQNHLYLTPVKKKFTLSENPQNKLLHTYVHITTLPAVDRLIEIPVLPDTPLADAVALLRKHIKSSSTELLLSIIQVILTCIGLQSSTRSTVEERTKEYLDHITDFSFDMNDLCHALGYTREHITRNFSRAYHLTPKQYFNRWRMEYALRQLQDGARIATVSEQLRFSSPYAFSKAFKLHFGLAPEKYLQTLATDGTEK